MCGRATFAMDESSTSMNVASVTVTATIHGFIFGFHGAWATTGAAWASGMSEMLVAVAIFLVVVLIPSPGCGIQESTGKYCPEAMFAQEIRRDFQQYSDRSKWCAEQIDGGR